MSGVYHFLMFLACNSTRVGGMRILQRTFFLQLSKTCLFCRGKFLARSIVEAVMELEHIFCLVKRIRGLIVGEWLPVVKQFCWNYLFLDTIKHPGTFSGPKF